MGTNSFNSSVGIDQRKNARDYWFAIVDAQSKVMHEIESRTDYVKSWNKLDEKTKLLTFRFDKQRTAKTMICQISRMARINECDIDFYPDGKYERMLIIRSRKYYNYDTMRMAESIANLYGYGVPTQWRKYSDLNMSPSNKLIEAVNTGLESGYEEEEVMFGNTKIGKCVKRNLNFCVVELNDDAVKMWKEKRLIKEGVAVSFACVKKSSLIKCFHEALNRLFGDGKAPVTENPRLVNFLFDTALAMPVNEYKKITCGDMNDEQMVAVAKALVTEDLSIIQGPPGTGKTTVIAEIVRRKLAENPASRILIASQTNVAIDNAIERLVKREGIRPLRIGRLKKMSEKVKRYSYQRINEWTAGETEEECAAAEMCAREENEDELHYKARCREAYLKGVNVMAATCCSSGMGSMRWAYNEVYNHPSTKENPWFDYVIIDEASKATLLDMAIPMVMAKHIIVIGDHKQLPPYCDKEKSQMLLGLVKKGNLMKYVYDSKNKEMRPSQFERMINRAKDENPSIVTTLRTQYRMHEKIMDLTQIFYKEEGELKCGVEDSERQHGLSFKNWLGADDHAIFININGQEDKDGTSWVNKTEEEVIRKVVEALRGSAKVNGMKMPETGIISFYKPQAKRFEDIEGVKAATVDSFQGAERDVIILSTVRSDRLGFIKDRRRLNVALSRARSLLIVVGNKRLLQGNEDYRSIIDKMTVIDYADIENTL